VNAVQAFVNDGTVIFRRNLIKVLRVPDILVFTLISPIMFVLLFAYVFGGSIDLAGGTTYREFLIAGVFVQTVVFGATFTGMGVADDMQKGVIDRFRSLPMARSAVLVGRTISDIGINVISLVVMALTGLVVGWRVHSTIPKALGGFALILLFAYSFSWVMAWLGLKVKSPEVVNNASFIVIFPLTFIANTFVPLENLPGPLRVFAEWNPVSAATKAARELFGNSSGVAVQSNAWPLQHPVLWTVLSGVAIVAVFAPLAVREYNRAASRD
jgi:ABC-2 type transport system permease protein